MVIKPADVALVIAVIASLFLNIPQVLKIIKTKEVRALSVKTIILRIIINISFTIFGVFESDWLFVGLSIEIGLSECVLLFLKKKYTKDQKQNAETTHGNFENVCTSPFNVALRNGAGSIQTLVASV